VDAGGGSKLFLFLLLLLLLLQTAELEALADWSSKIIAPAGDADGTNWKEEAVLHREELMQLQCRLEASVAASGLRAGSLVAAGEFANGHTGTVWSQYTGTLWSTHLLPTSLRGMSCAAADFLRLPFCSMVSMSMSIKLH
jgi:hypothetical protein